MSTRSKFERKLGFREVGFSIKIPDVGRSLKPFDYVVGVPVSINGIKTLRFAAIEAKTARGWTLPGNSLLQHQHNALTLVESMAKHSSWVAIGFLDMPKMKLDWDRKPLREKMAAEAYLLWWEDFLYVQKGNGSVSYGDIIYYYSHCKMDYVKVGTAYKWVPPPGGDFYRRVSGQNV